MSMAERFVFVASYGDHHQRKRNLITAAHASAVSALLVHCPLLHASDLTCGLGQTTTVGCMGVASQVAPLHMATIAVALTKSASQVIGGVGI